jgi:hypothetical protein
MYARAGVDATRPNAFSVRYMFCTFAGGARGRSSFGCFAADTGKGTLTKLFAKVLPADGRKKVEALTNAALKKENNVTKLTDAGFSTDDVTLSDDTTSCVEGTDLVVQFQPYEVAPYAIGAPSAKIAKADAALLVTGTALEAFFK